MALGIDHVVSFYRFISRSQKMSTSWKLGVIIYGEERWRIGGRRGRDQLMSASNLGNSRKIEFGAEIKYFGMNEAWE